MNLPTRVLCATYLLSTHQRTVTEFDIARHAQRPRADVRAALDRLGSAGLVEVRAAGSYRLTLSGLVIAVAVARARQTRGPRRGAISRAA